MCESTFSSQLVTHKGMPLNKRTDIGQDQSIELVARTNESKEEAGVGLVPKQSVVDEYDDGGFWAWATVVSS